MKKRVLTAVLSAVAATFILVGCSKQVHCAFCDGQENGEANRVYGNSISLCDMCSNDFNVFIS